MNEILHKLTVALALLLLPLWLIAQSGSAILVTTKNIPVTYSFTSNPIGPSAPVSPQNGEIDFSGSVNSGFIVTYTPDEDYIGSDYFRLKVYQNWNFHDIDVYVQVKPALIEARPDYGTTMESVPVVLPVLDNDFSSNTVKILSSVPAINHGTAEIVNNEIIFTPEPGFAGLAHFNYVICNGAETCNETFVNVSVMGNGTPQNDTVRVFVKRDTTQFILAPDYWTPISGPDFGSYDPTVDVPIYRPDPTFVGNDHITFSHDGVTTHYDIRVLDIATNVNVVDDRVYTTVGSEVEFNVFENDVSGLSTSEGCFTFTQPEAGQVVMTPIGDARGTLIYTPDPGFVGVDKFTYTQEGVGCNAPVETGTVYVFVSNFEPDAGSFRMSTPKMTPIIIGYNIPTGVFSFSIAEQGDLGDAIFLPGVVDTTIYGVPISGTNMLIYVPHTTTVSGEDEFEVDYCLLDPSNNTCAVAKTVKITMDILDIGNGDPLCVGDCVWAGDTNFDGVVSMADLLPIGWSMGQVGDPRVGATLDYWYGQYADDWSDLFLGPQSNLDAPNLKHIDADGDSIVTALDTAAISQFYGRMHTMIPKELPFTTFDVILEGDIFASPGDVVTLKVKVGEESNPAADVYGFVLPFNYNPLIFVPGSVDVTFANDSWLSYDSPVLQMQHNNLTGKVEAGYTRTNGLSASGFGEIGEVSFTIVTDLPPIRSDEPYVTMVLGGQAATAMTSTGETVAVNVKPFTLKIRLDDDPTETLPTDDQLKVFPNPTQQYVRVHLNGGHTFQEVYVCDMMGRTVQSWNLGAQTQTSELDLSGLPTGVYLIQVVTPDTTLTRKVQVVR